MSGVNEVRLLGYLGKDPDLKYTGSGTAVCTFDIGTPESVKQRDGTWKDIIEWNRVVVWQKQGESCAKFLAKKSRVYVKGKLTKRSYEKDGRKQYVTEVLAEKVIFLSEKKAGETHSKPSTEEEYAASSFDDQIPF